MGKNTFKQPDLQAEDLDSLSAKLFLANSELQKLQNERSEMMANLSHDLRAPITAIRSALDLLLSGHPLSEIEQKSALSTIDRRTATLEHLIQDMYLLFRAEDTSHDLSLTKLDAAPFLEEYFYDASVDKRYESHNLRLEIPEDLSCQISVDVQLIVRVLDNLFTNAAKYTPSGSDITLKAESEQNGAFLSVSVCDNGPGIAAKDLPHIFERTYTLSSSRTPNAETGSGLGLSIAKAIIERHGGSIACASVPGVGTAFTFCLPCLIKA